MPPNATPAELGYRMPAEWEPHAATWLSWPHNRESWPGAFDAIPGLWAELTAMLCRFEPVAILAGGGRVMADARARIGHLPRVTLFDVETDDAWTRDHGPIFLAGPARSEPALVDWRFNAWGGKYEPYERDNAVPRRVAELLGYRRFASQAVVEGGSIDTDGRGTFLAGKACLVDPRRNPGLDRLQIERLLADYLGARKVLWLTGAIAGDDTDGHVDQVARFVQPGVAAAAVEADPQDENYTALAENYRRLQEMTDAAGHRLEVIPLPMPPPQFFGERRLPASYLNFYIANGAIVMPRFDDPADDVVSNRLARLFPGRVIRGLPSRDLCWGLGGVHCITQQQPLVRGAG